MQRDDGPKDRDDETERDRAEEAADIRLMRLQEERDDDMAEWDGTGRCPACQGDDCSPETGCRYA